MNIPATKEEILENFKQNSNGRPLNKDDYEIAEALSRITYKAYEVGMEDVPNRVYVARLQDTRDVFRKNQGRSGKRWADHSCVVGEDRVIYRDHPTRRSQETYPDDHAQENCCGLQRISRRVARVKEKRPHGKIRMSA